MISIFFIACKGETPSNIGTTAQAVASLTVSKILPGNYRPLNTSIPVCLAFAFRYSKRSMLRRANQCLCAATAENGLAFDRVAAETMNDGRQLPCGLKFVLNAALEPARNITPAHEFFHLYQYGYAVLNKMVSGGWRDGWRTALKRLEKNTRRLSPLPHCDSNFTRVITPRITGRALRKHILLMSLSPPQHSVFVTATVRQF